MAKPSFESYTAGYELGDDTLRAGRDRRRDARTTRRPISARCAVPRRPAPARARRLYRSHERRAAALRRGGPIEPARPRARRSRCSRPRSASIPRRWSSPTRNRMHGRRRRPASTRASGARDQARALDHDRRTSPAQRRRTGGGRHEHSLSLRALGAARTRARAHAIPTPPGAARRCVPKSRVGLTLQAKQDGNTVDRGLGQRRPHALRSGRHDRHRSASRRAHRSASRTSPTSSRTTCAIVDFDPPDFPWLLTPAHAERPHRLRPWLVLVVVERAKVEPPALKPRTAAALDRADSGAGRDRAARSGRVVAVGARAGGLADEPAADHGDARRRD